MIIENVDEHESAYEFESDSEIDINSDEEFL